MKAKRSAAMTVPAERIGSLVLQLRGHKVMLDADLARLYRVPVKVLNQAVKRNIERFPEDFMFRLTKHDIENLKSQFAISSLEKHDIQYVGSLRSQIVTLNASRGKNIKYLPYAFTEQGVAMLSSVLRSKRAIEVNIAIMRAFVSLRTMMRSQETIKRELAALKRQYRDHDDQIKAIFLMIDEIIASAPVKPKRKIGFV